jgi:hypothetical protein
VVTTDGSELVIGVWREPNGPGRAAVHRPTRIRLPGARTRQARRLDGMQRAVAGRIEAPVLRGSSHYSLDGIYSIGVDGTGLIRLTRSPFHDTLGSAGECGGGDSEADYSPDGTRFVFMRKRCGTGPDPSSDEASATLRAQPGRPTGDGSSSRSPSMSRRGSPTFTGPGRTARIQPRCRTRRTRTSSSAGVGRPAHDRSRRRLARSMRRPPGPGCPRTAINKRATRSPRVQGRRGPRPRRVRRPGCAPGWTGLDQGRLPIAGCLYRVSPVPAHAAVPHPGMSHAGMSESSVQPESVVVGDTGVTPNERTSSHRHVRAGQRLDPVACTPRGRTIRGELPSEVQRIRRLPPARGIRFRFTRSSDYPSANSGISLWSRRFK